MDAHYADLKRYVFKVVFKEDEDGELRSSYGNEPHCLGLMGKK